MSDCECASILSLLCFNDLICEEEVVFSGGRRSAVYSVCRWSVYCSFCVAPADGERKRLYGMNESAAAEWEMIAGLLQSLL